MVDLFANSGEPDQRQHSVASDLGLHCLPFILGVSRLQWLFRRSIFFLLYIHLFVCLCVCVRFLCVFFFFVFFSLSEK